MQVARLVQAVVLMLILAMAASCSAGKDFGNKIFLNRDTVIKNSESIAIRFLDLGELDSNKENWVTTDIITGKDTVKNTIALDKLSNQIPLVKKEIKDTLEKTNSEESIPVAKTTVNKNGTRQKKVRGE